jgi:dienelactone hydrolase
MRVSFLIICCVAATAIAACKDTPPQPRTNQDASFFLDARSSLDAEVPGVDSGPLSMPDGSDAPDVRTPMDAQLVDTGIDVTAQRSDIEFTTADGVRIYGALVTSALSPPGAPAVLLLHQYRQDSNQWGMFPERLAERGYRVLAVDLRGHGRSDPYSGTQLSDILNDPNGAPRDVDAAIAYLTGDGQADASRIAILGTSIGANLAVAAAVRGQGKTSIAFSPRKPPSENLAGQTAQGMRSVFYLAGELDSGGQAQDCETMFADTMSPKELMIYPGTSQHGISLLQGQSDAEMKVFDWLTQNL